MSQTTNLSLFDVNSDQAHNLNSDPLKLYDLTIDSRLLLGTAQYPSPKVLAEAIARSGTQMVTVSVRREAGVDGAGQQFWSLIKDTGSYVLPNTAGCRTVQEAVTTAHMARELFDTPRIKLELIGNEDTLQPDVFALVEAAQILSNEGFQVYPYTTDDLIVAEKLLQAGCEVLMPWGAPIGSGQGLQNPKALQTLRAYFPDVPLVIDAGIGLPSQACQAMELGYDAILLNTAVAKAGDPITMATAFAKAIRAGRQAYQSTPILPRDMASPSTPIIGTPFWFDS
ncbi:thiazole synthase [Psychrobacter sp. DM4]|uniref:thiazole synthase n=1 Tax=Psychrobacter sp. DM4 TaxID=3440637 RepID=UPI003F4FBE92